MPWDSRINTHADIIINATPIGMTPDVETMPVNENVLDACRLVFDVVVSPPTSKLLKLAGARGKHTIPGYKMGLHQAAAQFKLYTGQEAPINEMEKAMLSFI